MKRLLVCLVLVGCGSSTVSRATTTVMSPSTVPSTMSSSTVTPSTSVPVASTAPGEPSGALNPAVTQETIGSTICVAGWTATVRPPSSYTSALKLQQMAALGLPGPASLYEEDHLVALELGGSPADPTNLWPELLAGVRGARAKDTTENRLKREVCAGTITLAAARAEILDPLVWGT